MIVGFVFLSQKIKGQKVCKKINIFREKLYSLKEEVGGWYNLLRLLISGLRYNKTKPEMFWNILSVKLSKEIATLDVEALS